MGRAKQQHLEGMAPPTIPSLDDAADKYVDARDARLKLLAKEKDAKKTLMSEMGENGLDFYKTSDGLTVRLTSTAGVKVLDPTKPEEDDDEGEDDE